MDLHQVATLKKLSLVRDHCRMLGGIKLLLKYLEPTVGSKVTTILVELFTYGCKYLTQSKQGLMMPILDLAKAVSCTEKYRHPICLF